MLIAFIAMQYAAALTPLDASAMDARVLITNAVTLQQAGEQYYVERSTARLLWYPLDDTLQDVHAIETTPPSNASDGALEFTWLSPQQQESFSLDARVRTHNDVVPVRKRIPFPLADIPPEVQDYLGAGVIADQSAGIQQLAQELAAGKDDAYEVAYALADWTTTNVEYSLVSLGQPAIQRSSQVLATREGKCDELTALFISLNRAVGIPARFVAGYSYTNAERVDGTWGGHGWAEIWLPDVGWVPFDVTYGEYGYLDAGHVKLRVAPDPKETSVEYFARGVDFKIQTEPLSIYVTPTSLEAGRDDRIEITLDTPYRTVGFGSAVPIIATVRNRKDYYVATRLDLSQATETEMLSDTYRNLLLRPYETRTVSFLVRIGDNLDRNYRYTFPFRLATRLGEEATIEIVADGRAVSYDADAFAETITRYETTPSPRAPYGITCDRTTAYAAEDATHTCTVSGDYAVPIEICATTCIEVTPTGGAFTLTTNHVVPGIHTDAYTARSGGKDATFFVTSRVVNAADVLISFEGAKRLTPDDTLALRVRLEHTGALPENVTLTLATGRISAQERVERLDVPATFEFSIPGNALRPGENEIRIRTAYVDELGTPGEDTALATVILTDVSFLDRVYFFFADLGAWLESAFS